MSDQSAQFSDGELQIYPLWRVEGIREAAAFFSAIGDLLPVGTELYIEGTSISPEIQVLLESHRIEPSRTFPQGTLFPRPRRHYLHAADELLRGLATLAERHAVPEICDHLLAHCGGRVVLNWYDAFDADLLLDGSLPEEKVHKFCRAVAARYSFEG